MFKPSITALAWALTFISTTCCAFQDTPADEPPADKISIPISGTFDVMTNYVSQGLSNTNNAPGIQGGLTYTFAKTGIYFNGWGTNSDFLGFRDQHVTAELDAIVGIANDINDDWSYDVYFDRYIYPGAPANNYNDLILSLTYKAFTLTGNFSTNVYGSHSTGIYINGAINYEIPETLIHFSNISALASAAHYSLTEASGLNSYYDFMLGIQKTIKQFTLTLQWTDTANTSSNINFYPYAGYHIFGTILYQF